MYKNLYDKYLTKLWGVVVLDKIFWYWCHFDRLAVPLVLFLAVLELVLLFVFFLSSWVSTEIFDDLFYAGL